MSLEHLVGGYPVSLATKVGCLFPDFKDLVLCAHNIHNMLFNLKKSTIMSKFLIEVPHGAEKYECMRSIAIFLNSGSHFLANADWGCSDGEHKAWFIMEADNKEEVLQVVPPVYRLNTKITQLIKYNLADMEAGLKHHTA